MNAWKVTGLLLLTPLVAIGLWGVLVALAYPTALSVPLALVSGGVAGGFGYALWVVLATDDPV